MICLNTFADDTSLFSRIYKDVHAVQMNEDLKVISNCTDQQKMLLI